MKLDSLEALFLEELADIHSAETQLLNALPKMSKAATNPKLKQAFDEHITETEDQLRRIEEIFDALDKNPKAKTCKAMKGLIEEGGEMAKQTGDESVIDAGLIAAAQRVEHYEIAAYGCARTYADLLGHTAAVEALQTSLDEEKRADETLNTLAKNVINLEAARAT